MNESKINEKLRLSNDITMKLDQLSAITSSLIALGLSASGEDSLPFIPDEMRTKETFLALGQMANQLHGDLCELNEQILATE